VKILLNYLYLLSTVKLLVLIKNELYQKKIKNGIKVALNNFKIKEAKN
jgi:hypothetical protein